MRATAASEIGQMAADAIGEIVRRAVGSRTMTEYVEGNPIAWETFEAGGWDRIGVSEADGGGGATLRDLAEIAFRWGAWSVPLPLLETVLARRWSTAARETPGPVTVAIASVGISSGSGLVPFGALPNVAIARSLGSDTDGFKSGDDAMPEPFAHGLRCAVVPWVTDLPPTARHELEVVWAAEAVGASQRLLDLAVGYAKERVQFGKPIGSFQAVKHQLADMHIEVQLGESAVLWASLEADQTRRVARYAVDAAIRVAESAIQVHGAMGFTWELGLHYYLRSMLVRRELLTAV
jgi:alkylation response protein AidB-like acyl-CoA dehydrogenase